MSDPRTRPERLGRCLLRAAALAGVAGAAVGAAAALPLLSPGEARYADWGAALLAISIAGHALAGAGLGAVCALPALALWRPAEHRAAPASACAGLGAALGLAAWVVRGSPGLTSLIAAALAGTLLVLALREVLAWWPLPARPLAWGAFAALLTAAGLFLLLRMPRPGPDVAAPTDGERANVLLVTVDTLRADRLGCYGNPTARTPRIDALASQGILFEQATAQSNTTGPSHATILTGLLPIEHSATINGKPLARDAVTLGERLAPVGYRSAAFVSGFTLADAACGFASRFERYDDRLLALRWMPQPAERLTLIQTAFQLAQRCGVRIQRSDRPAGETVDAALAWLERLDHGPFFLWVHLYDPHAPYEPPPPFDRMHDPSYRDTGQYGRFDWYELSTPKRRELVRDEAARNHMVALHDGEVSYADQEVGRLLDALTARGQLERTLVVFTSDHGEGLGPHDYFFDHGAFLYDEELHVPLILRMPGAEHAGSRIAAQARLSDVAPTVLEALKLEPEGMRGGSSLLGMLGDGPAAPERPSLALARMDGSHSGFALDGQRVSLRRGGLKLIWTSEHWLDTQRIEPRYELYDLARDPDELEDLIPRGDAIEGLEELRAELDLFRAACEQLDERGKLPPDVAAHLRRLGYF
ncbi:MAG TPA: sulfatase [Planctomycetota bacterium]|nr:sulfatase [Planctomycetota bacterium]